MVPLNYDSADTSSTLGFAKEPWGSKKQQPFKRKTQGGKVMLFYKTQTATIPFMFSVRLCK